MKCGQKCSTKLGYSTEFLNTNRAVSTIVLSYYCAAEELRYEAS